MSINLKHSLDRVITKAYLKKDPSRVGRILYVYTLDGQKRMLVEFCEDGKHYSSVDSDVQDFELIDVKEKPDVLR
jgi:hypothetical protein